MTSYDEMDELLKSVKEYVDKLKSVAEVQEELNKYVTDLGDLSTRCDAILVKAGEYRDFVDKLEGRYSRIDSSISDVLSTYRDVSNSFDLTKSEFGKIDAKQESFGEKINTVKNLLDDLEPKLASDVQTRLEDMMNEIAKRNYRTTVLLVILIFLAVAAVALGITALVI